MVAKKHLPAIIGSGTHEAVSANAAPPQEGKAAVDVAELSPEIGEEQGKNTTGDTTAASIEAGHLGVVLDVMGPAADGERGMSASEIEALRLRARELVPAGVPLVIHRWRRMGYRMASEAVMPGEVLDALVDWYDRHDHVAKVGAA